ncbi:MAG: PAS domain-containing protein [Nitrospiraceae bacterium]|nr:PAS domain-containing protein [Nitrospiraceae bacterium]
MKDPNIMTQMANILENAFFGTVTTDISLLVRYWNRKMESLTGIKRVDALGKPILDLLPWLAEEIVKTCMQKNVDIYDSKGKGTTLKITSIRGQSGGFILLFEEIIEKKTPEAQTQKSKPAAANPLASISSMLKEFKDMETASPESIEMMDRSLEDMNNEINKLSRITKNIGRFVKEAPLEKKPADVSEILNQTLDLLKLDKRLKNIELHKQFEKIPRLKVNADQIQQVFLNMMLNALDAMPDGGRLEISIKKTEGFADIEFKDNGVGIDSEVINKIFDAFFTTKSSNKGVGLGLNVSKNIIKSHNGAIDVKSERGKGASFVIRLPMEQNV